MDYRVAPGTDVQKIPQIFVIGPEGFQKPITVAKIADSLKDLGEDARINFNVHSRIECQIVRVKALSTSQGTFLVRQFVKADDF